MDWLYLHFPSLQLDELSANKVPTAIACPKRLQVLQLNKAAKNEGITLNMGLALACSLCSQLHVYPYEEDNETKHLQHLAHQLYHCSEDLSLFRPNGITLHITPMLRYYGGFTQYWERISQALNKEQVNFHAALAQTPLAAKVLALEHTPNTAPIQNSGLSSAALTQTELDPKTVQQLARVGIHNVKALLAIPLEQLADRLDKKSIEYLQKLTGKKSTNRDKFTPSEFFFIRRELNYACHNTSGLASWLPETLEALQSYLLQRSQLARQVSLQLYLEKQEPVSIKASSNNGEHRPEVWLRLLKLKLENLQLQQPFYAFSLEAKKNDCVKENIDLFNQQTHTQINELMSLLQARLPANAFNWPKAGNDHRPELSNTAKPLAEIYPLPLRPTFLTKTPSKLKGPLVIISGPERIATGWWDDKPVLRDYYIVRDKHGQWLWSFRNVADKKLYASWYLHGHFS